MQPRQMDHRLAKILLTLVWLFLASLVPMILVGIVSLLEFFNETWLWAMVWVAVGIGFVPWIYLIVAGIRLPNDVELFEKEEPGDSSSGGENVSV